MDMDAPETKDGPAEPEVEGRLGCFPFGFKRESKELFKLAWPLVCRIESRLLATMTVGLHTIKLGIIIQNYL